MKVVVDRFEGDDAIAELPSGEMGSFSKNLLPQVREGDVVILQIDREETEKRKKEIKELLEDIFEP